MDVTLDIASHYGSPADPAGFWVCWGPQRPVQGVGRSSPSSPWVLSPYLSAVIISRLHLVAVLVRGKLDIRQPHLHGHDQRDV